jgi:hypothetical protein
MRRVAAFLAQRRYQIVQAAEGRKPRPDAIVEIARCRALRFAETRLQDKPRFGLHGVAVLGCADTQSLLGHWIEASNGKGCSGRKGCSGDVWKRHGGVMGIAITDRNAFEL